MRPAVRAVGRLTRLVCAVALSALIWTPAAAARVKSKPPAVLRLSNADFGRTIHLHRGTTIAVTLGPDGLIWADPTSSDAHVVARVSFSQRRLSGVRATLRARRAGRATLSATGSCPPAAPGRLRCELIQAWKVNLVVS